MNNPNVNNPDVAEALKEARDLADTLSQLAVEQSLLPPQAEIISPEAAARRALQIGEILEAARTEAQELTKADLGLAA